MKTPLTLWIEKFFGLSPHALFVSMAHFFTWRFLVLITLAFTVISIRASLHSDGYLAWDCAIRAVMGCAATLTIIAFYWKMKRPLSQRAVMMAA